MASKDFSDLVYNPNNVLVEKIDTLKHYGIGTSGLDLIEESHFKYHVGKVVGCGESVKGLSGKTIYYVPNTGFVIRPKGTELDLVLVNAVPENGIILSVIN